MYIMGIFCITKLYYGCTTIPILNEENEYEIIYRTNDKVILATRSCSVKVADGIYTMEKLLELNNQLKPEFFEVNNEEYEKLKLTYTEPGFYIICYEVHTYDWTCCLLYNKKLD